MLMLPYEVNRNEFAPKLLQLVLNDRAVKNLGRHFVLSPLCVCVCVCVCICVYMCVYVPTCLAEQRQLPSVRAVSVCVCNRSSVYAHLCIKGHGCAHLCECVCFCVYACVCLLVCVCMCVFVC